MMTLANPTIEDWDAIYNQEAPFLGRMLLRMTTNASQAEEMLQEVFMIAYQKQDSYDPERAKIGTWLYSITRNVALRRLRDQGRFYKFISRLGQQTPVEFSLGPDEQVDTRREATLAFEALKRLKPIYREVLTLHELEDMEGQEIADLLDIPLNTVWTRLHNARKKLRIAYRALSKNKGGNHA
jgi:RNA polymerase sigma-70 factor (ECF subfamily)